MEQNEKKKVGFRYCGGCNPRYDRGAMVKRLMEKHPQWDAAVASEDVCYDLLVVVGGCSACCAAYEQYRAEKVLKVWEDLADLPADAV